MEAPLLLMNPDSELTFEFVLNSSSSSTLHIKNNTDENVSFKIKTTAPKNYLVRPNQGILTPHEAKLLSIILQPMSEDPGVVNHKFMVQACTTTLPEDCSQADLNTFWNTRDKDSVQSSRLKVNLVRAESRSSVPQRPLLGSEQVFQTASIQSKADELSKQNADLEEYNVTFMQLKLAKEKEDLEKELNRINDEQRKRETLHAGTVEIEAGGIGFMHVMLALLVGIILGYIVYGSKS